MPRATIPRSSFNRSSTLKTTLDGGLIVPVYIDEVLPGDTFSLRASLFGRIATPIKPVLDNLVLEQFWFFVPNRLVWDNWQKFNGEQDNPTDSTDYVIPTIDGISVTEGSLADYFGLPVGNTIPGVNALPFRGYNLIYNEWFRDQNLQDSQPVPKDDGPDSDTLYKDPLRRGKRHDYFTSCLPWPQKGDPVMVGLGDKAPVYAESTSGLLHIGVEGQGTSEYTMRTDQGGGNFLGVSATPSTGDQNTMYTDLSLSTGITINDLRQAFQIQKLLERDARGGTRYTEIVRSHFGVISPDARLQRPEFLGGGSQMISMHPVAQTTQDIDGAGANTPQGNLAAFGTVSAQGGGFTKSFTEHGYIFGFVNVRADLTYQQGIQRMWSRKDRYDFYWPALSHIGEMAVLNKEIYYSGNAGDDEGVFGYQEAYGDYRYKPSLITGRFRSAASESLDVWHYAQDFANLPVLGSEFIEDNPPIDRTIAVQTEPHLLLDAFFQCRCARPMPLYGVPGLIDHF